MPDHYDDPSEDDWYVPSDVDGDGRPVSRDPNAPSLPPNPYDDALVSRPPDVDADGKPVSTPDNPVYSDVPMEDGLEDEDPVQAADDAQDAGGDAEEDDDPKEDKPPVQKLRSRKPIRLPGAKGPLEVDSIGDYLEDADWSSIDEEARERANKAREQQQANEAAWQQAEQEKLAQRKAASDNRKDAKASRRARRVDEPPPEPPEDPVTGDDIARAADNLGIGDIGTFNPNAAPTGSFQTVGLPQNPMLPPSSPATPEHLARQQQIDLADYGSNGPSSFSQPGHNQTAKEDAVERATDAINTATGRIVDVLTVLAQVMNNHSHRIAQVEDQLDMESERDVS